MTDRKKNTFRVPASGIWECKCGTQNKFNRYTCQSYRCQRPRPDCVDANWTELDRFKRPPENERLLYEYIQSGKEKPLQTLLNRDPSLTRLHDDDPLWHAIQKCHHSITKLLLSRGARLSSQRMMPVLVRSLLKQQARDSYRAIHSYVQLLLHTADLNVDVNVTLDAVGSPLTYLIYALLEELSTVHVWPASRETRLLSNARHLMRILVANGVDPDVHDQTWNVDYVDESGKLGSLILPMDERLVGQMVDVKLSIADDLRYSYFVGTTVTRVLRDDRTREPFAQVQVLGAYHHEDRVPLSAEFICPFRSRSKSSALHLSDMRRSQFLVGTTLRERLGYGAQMLQRDSDVMSLTHLFACICTDLLDAIQQGTRDRDATRASLVRAVSNVVIIIPLATMIACYVL